MEITTKSLGTTPVTIPHGYVGVTYLRPHKLGNQIPLFSNLVRIYDVGEEFPGFKRGHWRGVHISAGQFDWSYLDIVVEKLYGLGCTLLYTLAVTPQWASAKPEEPGAYGPGSAAGPSNMVYWTDFCTAIGTRYKGKIMYYEVWNEPNAKNHYTGNVVDLAIMTRLASQTLKGIDPAIQIISPPVVNLTSGNTGIPYFNNMINANDGAWGIAKKWYDIIGCHLYAGSAQIGSRAAEMCSNFKVAVTSAGLGTKEIWNTETGLLVPDGKLLGLKRLEAIKQSMLVAAAFGFKRWIFYAYDHGTMGIDDSPAVVADFNSWVASIAGKHLQVLDTITTENMFVRINNKSVVF